MFKNLLGESGVIKALMKFEDKVFEMFEDDPLDEYDIDSVVDMLKLRMNFRHGNMTEEEYAQGLINLDRSPDNYAATLISEWEDGTVIHTEAVYNHETGGITVEAPEPVKESELISEELSAVIQGVACTFTVCPECSAAVSHVNGDGDTVCAVCGVVG